MGILLPAQTKPLLHLYSAAGRRMFASEMPLGLPVKDRPPAVAKYVACGHTRHVYKTLIDGYNATLTSSTVT